MKFTILVHLSWVIITIYVICLINAWQRTEKDFSKKYSIITTYLVCPKITPPLGWGGGGHEIFNFLSPYPTDSTHTKFG